MLEYLLGVVVGVATYKLFDKKDDEDTSIGGFQYESHKFNCDIGPENLIIGDLILDDMILRDIEIIGGQSLIELKLDNATDIEYFQNWFHDCVNIPIGVDYKKDIVFETDVIYEYFGVFPLMMNSEDGICTISLSVDHYKIR